MSNPFTTVPCPCCGSQHIVIPCQGGERCQCKCRNCKNPWHHLTSTSLTALTAALNGDKP